MEDVGTLIEASQVGQKKIEREREKRKQNGETKRKMKFANGKAGTEKAEIVEVNIPNLVLNYI